MALEQLLVVSAVLTSLLQRSRRWRRYIAAVESEHDVVVQRLLKAEADYYNALEVYGADKLIVVYTDGKVVPVRG